MIFLVKVINKEKINIKNVRENKIFFLYSLIKIKIIKKLKNKRNKAVLSPDNKTIKKVKIENPIHKNLYF